MAENESYWRKHHWGIIQGLSGLYCAVFATWDRFHPRSIPTAEGIATAHPTQVGVAMIPSYSMPFWLWVGIVVFVLSVIVPGIIRMINTWKSRRKEGDHSPTLPSIREAAKAFATGHNHDVYVKTGIQALELFTPLQLEAFKLSHDLGKWYADFDPEPIYAGHPTSAEEYMNFIFSGGAHGDWADKFNASFQLIWAKQIETLALRFGAQGVKDNVFGALLDQRTNPSKRIMEIRCRITCMAHVSEGILLHPVEL